MTEKYCGAGKHYVDTSMFHKKGTGTQPNCRDCQNRLNRERYKSNKDSHIQAVKQNTKARSELFAGWKSQLKCECCGESFSQCLDFHHIDSSSKEFTLSEAIGRYGLLRMVEELKKCVVLCKNCHCKVHANVLTLPATNQMHGAIDLLVDLMGHKL